MGGHTQFGNFFTLDLAVLAFKAARERYEKELGLFLSYAQIVYEDKTKLYWLSMRFSK